MAVTVQCGDWQAACEPEDGARLTRLCWRGVSLLTAAPPAFRPPAADYGRYETRPVFGYDDCFPTVNASVWPDGTEIPDHGELCWLPAAADQPDACTLRASFRSRQQPLCLERTLRFRGRTLAWNFRVRNDGDRTLACLHVMHALLPVDEVRVRRLPPFARCVSEEPDGRLVPDRSRMPGEVIRRLEETRGAARMLLLQGIRKGHFDLVVGGLPLTVTFPRSRFPTLGIWWNIGGYPDEAGLRRRECAFEPIPGSSSALDACCRDRSATLRIPPRSTRAWTVGWRIGTARTTSKT
jgi:hypothetical protein